MQTSEWTRIGFNTQLDLQYLHARYVEHAYPRHNHDYYVITLIERGRQSFTHQGTKHLTPPGGVILINPGAVHTGEAVDKDGFEMRSFYPTTAHMEQAVFDLTGRWQGLPFFKEVRVDHPWAMNNILSLHEAMLESTNMLEWESRFKRMSVQLVKRYADTPYTEQKLGREKKAVVQACQYIEEFYAKGVSLNELAEHVALSPYYLLRVFREEIGMPPYAYLESVRIHHAQQFIKSGKLLVDAAVESGFSSQNQMTRHFKKIIGVTPGQYAQHIRA